MPRAIITSTSFLEPWDWRTPFRTGVGGSETSAIEMATRLDRRGFDVVSYTPIPDDCNVMDAPCPWGDSRALTAANLGERGPGIIINYRDPGLFRGPKPPNQRWWFVAQDVDAPGTWTQEALASVDRYLCLCQEHARYTRLHYPMLRGRIYVSGNGVRTDYLDRHFPIGEPRERVPYRMLYASSPDRGLKLLLEQWWRVKERFPDATLRIAYGFENMDKIIAHMGGADWRAEYKADLEALFDQPGVTWLGRLAQDQLYQEWHMASVWAHPTDFCETSCVVCMEAQACGAIPVTNPLWALADNVQYGYLVDGIPQKNELVRHQWLGALFRALEYTNGKLHGTPGAQSCDAYRSRMMRWARDRFDWECVVNQWAVWLRTDLSKIGKGT